MAPFDIAVIAILTISAAFAFWRGFATEALSLAAWVGALAATLFAYPWTAEWTRQYLTPEWLANTAAVVVVFVFSFFILKWLANFIGARVRESSLGPIDRGLGALFGMLRGLILMGLVFMLYEFIVGPAKSTNIMSDSRTGPLVQYTAYLMRNFAERGGDNPDFKQLKELLPDWPKSTPPSDPDSEAGYDKTIREKLEGLVESITQEPAQEESEEQDPPAQEPKP